MKRFARLPWALAAAAILALPTPQSTAQQPRPKDLVPVRILPPQPEQPLVMAGPEPDLEVLFTSEVLGYYQPCG